MLYETALLESGFVLEDPSLFAKRVYAAVTTNLGIDPSVTADEDDEINIEEEKEEKKVSKNEQHNYSVTHL